MTPDSLDFLAVAPEVVLTAGVVLLLLVEVNTKLGSRAWAMFATLGLGAATAMSIWQFAAYRLENAQTFAGSLKHPAFQAEALSHVAWALAELGQGERALKVAKQIGPIDFDPDGSCDPMDVTKHLTSDYVKKKLGL